jgi:hypothetical protein
MSGDETIEAPQANVTECGTGGVNCQGRCGAAIGGGELSAFGWIQVSSLSEDDPTRSTSAKLPATKETAPPLSKSDSEEVRKLS